MELPEPYLKKLRTITAQHGENKQVARFAGVSVTTLWRIVTTGSAGKKGVGKVLAYLGAPTDTV